MSAAIDNRAPSDAARQINDHLVRFRRHGRLVATSAGLTWCLVAATALLTAFVAALGWWGGDTVRIVGWLVVVVALIVVFGVAVVGPLQHLASPEMIARRIGRKIPEIASAVLSACQLSLAEWNPAFSRVLVLRHLDGARDQLDGIRADAIFPRRALVAPISAAFAFGLVSTALCFAIPGVMMTGAGALLTDPHAPELALVRKAARAPVVRDLTFTLYYPDYLDREPRRFDASSGGLSAPIGTSVVLEAQSRLPGVDRGTIALPGGEVAPIQVLADGRVSGRFTVTSPGAFHLSLGTESSLTSGPDRPIEIEADQPPTIEITRPIGEVEIDENGEEIIEFEAADDNGIDHVDLVLHSGLGKETRKTIARTAKHVTRYKGRHRFSPASLRLEGGPRVELEFEVFDNDTIRGPKPGRSHTLVVKLMTRLSRHEEVLAEQNRTLDAAVDLLADRLEPPAALGAQKDPVSAGRFDLLRSETEDLLGRSARLIHRMNQDPFSSRAVVDAVIQMRDDLSNQLIHESRFYGEPLGPKKQRQSADRVTVKLLESAVLRIDDLVLDQQLSRLVADGGLLERSRDEIAHLIDNFAKSRSESVRRALLEAVDRLAQLSRQLEQGLRGVRGDVVDAYVNDSRSAVVDLGAQLERLKALVASDSLAEAAELAAQLEQKLSGLVTSLESGRLSYRRDRFGEGEKFLGDLFDKLLAVESEELQLRRETTAIQRWYQERLMDLMRGRIDPLVKRQLAEVNGVEEKLGEIRTATTAEQRELLVRARVAARELELALGQGDLDEARQLAEDLVDAASGIDEADETAFAQGLRAVERTASGLVDELTEAYPRPAQVFGDRERGEMREQAAAQRHLAAQTRNLKAWIKEQGDDPRFLMHQAGAALDEVIAHMEQSVTGLESKQLRDALEGQTAALDVLGRLREDLKRGDDLLPLESRPAPLEVDVDIPAPDDYAVPAEFRKDILDAMRDEAPSDYREAIRKYYEILVR
jgi:hypothetical protein